MTAPSSTLNADYESPAESYRRFVIANLAAGTLIYPCFSLVAICLFWSTEICFAASLVAANLVHLTFFWLGIVHYRRVSQFLVPWLSALAGILLYHRHSDGTPDNSPFSNGIGTVAQQVWGLNGWYRVFDNPAGQFGPSYLDWAAVSLSIEASLMITIIIVVPVAAGYFRLWLSVNRAVEAWERERITHTISQ